MDLSMKSSFTTTSRYPNTISGYHSEFSHGNEEPQLSQRAKAFSIDSLLNMEKDVKPVIPVSNKREPTSHVNHVILNSIKEERSVVDYTTPDKRETLMAENPSSHNNGSLWTMVNHLTVQGPIFSPFMTCGYRPTEMFSPMSNQGQDTPLGLRSVHLQTPDSKSVSSDVTPTGRLSRHGGRKMLSHHSRRQERSHPYTSPRQQVDSPCLRELEQLIQNVTRPTDQKKTVKSKRFRTAFTPEQLIVLEEEFEKQQYCVGDERIKLAESLNLSVSQVKVWFQNRRIKWRKEQFEQVNY